MQVQLMTKYLISDEYQDATEVPDPFHGGPEGFEKVRSCHVILHNHQVTCTQSLLQCIPPYMSLSIAELVQHKRRDTVASVLAF